MIVTAIILRNRKNYLNPCGMKTNVSFDHHFQRLLMTSSRYSHSAAGGGLHETLAGAASSIRANIMDHLAVKPNTEGTLNSRLVKNEQLDNKGKVNEFKAMSHMTIYHLIKLPV